MQQKWPDKIFPMVYFVFSRDGPFGLVIPSLLRYTAILILPLGGGGGHRGSRNIHRARAAYFAASTISSLTTQVV